MLVASLLTSIIFGCIGWALYARAHVQRVHRSALLGRYRASVSHLDQRVRRVEMWAAGEHAVSPSPELARLQCEIVQIRAELEKEIDRWE